MFLFHTRIRTVNLYRRDFMLIDYYVCKKVFFYVKCDFSMGAARLYSQGMRVCVRKECLSKEEYMKSGGSQNMFID